MRALLRNFLSDMIGIGAKGILLAVAPMAMSLNEENQSAVLVKPEVVSLLEKYGRLEAFEKGKEYCKYCNLQLSFDNLGLLIEKKELELTCDNPGCTLRA